LAGWVGVAAMAMARVDWQEEGEERDLEGRVVASAASAATAAETGGSKRAATTCTTSRMCCT
jgi:hypothetical protein